MPDGCLYALLAGLAVEAMVFVCFGLLALIASAGEGGSTGTRLAIAFVAFVIGGAQLLAVGLIFHRKMRLRPSAVELEVIALAQSTRAPMTVAEVASQVGFGPDEAKATLEAMVSKRLCRQTGPDSYEVVGVGGHKIQRKCPYCGASLPVREQTLVCPQCGADLELKRDL